MGLHGIVLFIFYPGRVPHIHQIILSNRDTVLRGVARIEFSRFSLDFLSSFAGMLLYSLSVTSLELAFLRVLGIGWDYTNLSKPDLAACLCSAFLAG